MAIFFDNNFLTFNLNEWVIGGLRVNSHFKAYTACKKEDPFLSKVTLNKGHFI